MPPARRVAALVATALLAGCGTGATSAPTTVAPTPAPPSTAAPPATSAGPTTTAAFVPTVAEPTSSAAVARLLATWANHDRVSAGYVATPAAVAALFAVAPASLQPRGCSDGSPPVTCSYADRSPGGDFYDLSASQDPAGGWYVSDVQVTPLQ